MRLRVLGECLALQMTSHRNHNKSLATRVAEVERDNASLQQKVQALLEKCEQETTQTASLRQEVVALRKKLTVSRLLTRSPSCTMPAGSVSGGKTVSVSVLI